MLQNLVSEKVNIWEADKNNSYAYILEISEYFQGNRNWNKNPVVDQNYANWFSQMADNINSLDIKTATKTGRKIQQLSQALEEI
jgi:Hereditary spastic paraplegia protein strumpellin